MSQPTPSVVASPACLPPLSGSRVCLALFWFREERSTTATAAMTTAVVLDVVCRHWFRVQEGCGGEMTVRNFRVCIHPEGSILRWVWCHESPPSLHGVYFCDAGLDRSNAIKYYCYCIANREGWLVIYSMAHLLVRFEYKRRRHSPTFLPFMYVLVY